MSRTQVGTFLGLCIGACLAFNMAIPASWAGGSKKTFKIPFLADTKDLHIVVAGDIKSVTVSPAPTNGEEWDGGAYAAGWSVAPGAGPVSVKIERTTAGPWNLRYWRTTDGIGEINLKLHSTPPDGRLASLWTSCMEWAYAGPTTIYGENPGATTVAVTDIVATVVPDLESFEWPNWYEAAGTDYSLGDAWIPPGESALPIGDVTTTGKEWIKISASFDGVESIHGYSPVPEPSTLALLCLAGAPVLIHRARRRRKKPDSS